MWTTVMLHLRSRTFICLHAPLSSFQRSDLASNTVSECFLLSVEHLLANVSIQIWSVDLYLCSHYTDGWSLQCRRFCCAGCKAAMLKEICQLVPACGAIPLGFVSPGSRCGDCTGLTRLSITGEHGTSAERREWGLLQSSGRGTLINIQRLAGAVIATHADDCGGEIVWWRQWCLIKLMRKAMMVTVDKMVYVPTGGVRHRTRQCRENWS